MNAYQINEYDWYAAHSWMEAVALACENYGETREDTVDETVATEQSEDPNGTVRVSSDTDETMTVTEALSDMKGPGWCFGKEA